MLVFNLLPQSRNLIHIIINLFISPADHIFLVIKLAPQVILFSSSFIKPNIFETKLTLKIVYLIIQLGSICMVPFVYSVFLNL